MKIFNNLRGRILSAFSLLLFISFALIGLVFNVAINRYINHSASAAIGRQLAVFQHRQARPPGTVISILRGHGEFFYRNVRYFEIGEDFSIIDHRTLHSGWILSQEGIAERLGLEEVPLPEMYNRRIRIDGQTLYVTISPVEEGGYSFMVFYLDVTDIESFTHTINRMLLMLVVVIWLAAMAITTLLAGSLARPLKVLSAFARQIGSGNFTPNDTVFPNEEFEELNQSLNYAAKQLASYDNDQKTFFQNVSHELRTPLMSIKSYAEGIKYEIMPPDTASETILEATDKLSEMVNDILYVSRIDSNIAAPMKTENLSKIVEGRVNNQRRMAEKEGITLEYVSDGVPINIPCAVSYIERAIDNLISNSLRYAEKSIRVECYAIGSTATVRVMDDGPGFEPAALPHVFERFYRGKNGLTGIGLAMVKSIADQHNGVAKAENGEEKGAVLTISLPRTQKRAIERVEN